MLFFPMQVKNYGSRVNIILLTRTEVYRDVSGQGVRKQLE